MKKIVLAFIVVFGMTSVAEAHVVVKPAQVGVGSFQTFIMGVPVEKEVPTASVRLIIPEGLEFVTPNVKPGWKIQVVKEGTGESARVKEIIWTGGSIPPGQRDEFNFSAKVPSMETKLAWKAYQTYTNGEIVAWDQDPSTNTTHEITPFSVTKVVNDLQSSPTPTNSSNYLYETFSILALLISLVALGLSWKRKV